MDSDETDTVQQSRKSTRTRKRKKTYSPEPEDDEKKKRVRKTQPNRPYDILPNGEPFCCTLCKSSYVVITKGTKKPKMSRHTPLPKIRVDQRTGEEMQLCNACALCFDRPRHRPKKKDVVVTEEEQQTYINEAVQFTKSLKAHIDSPYVDRLYCPVSKKKLCGCLQHYITTEMQLSGVPACIERFVKLMKEADSLRKEKFYVNNKLPETKYKRTMIGLGNGHKKSKRYEEFVMSNRSKLKDEIHICERAVQRILMYSNNFLHKKLKTEDRPCRLERTRGKAAMGKLPEIHTLVDLTCCSENCVMMALTHKKLLQSWRERAKQGQMETRRVLAEMLTPVGATHRNCYHFIGFVTGCSASTISRVYNMMLENNGNREPPEHGMKKVWQESYKNNKLPGQNLDKDTDNSVEESTNRPVTSEPKITQKSTKQTSQNIITTSDSNIQYELQKQHLEQIQRDLMEKQQLLEQQQISLRLQLMAQQSVTHTEQTNIMNQAIFQQILQQIGQQQQQQQSQNPPPTQVDPGKVMVDQSTLPGSVSDNQSTPALPVFSLNVVNGQLQLNYAGHQTDQTGLQVPGVVNVAQSMDNQTNLLPGINDPTQPSITGHNTGHVVQPHIPDTAAVTVQDTNTLVNINGTYYTVGIPTNNLSIGEPNMAVTQNNLPAYPDTVSQNIAFEQPTQGSNLYITPSNEMNTQPMTLNQKSENNVEVIQALPNTQHTSSVQGEVNVGSIPIQVMDSSGHPCYIVHNPPGHLMVNSDNQVVNIQLPVEVSKQQDHVVMETDQTQKVNNITETNDSMENSVVSIVGSQNQVVLPKHVQFTHTSDNDHALLPKGQSVQWTSHTVDEGLDPGIQSEHALNHPPSVDRSTTLPVQTGASYDIVQREEPQTSTSHTGLPNKKNVQFKITQVQATSPDNIFEVQDSGHEETMVNPDMVMSKTSQSGLSTQSSRTLTKSGKHIGKIGATKHVTGKNATNPDSFEQLSHTFTLKDLNNSIKSKPVAKSNSKSLPTKSDKARQLSDKSRKVCSDKLKHPSGDHPRQASGNKVSNVNQSQQTLISRDRAQPPSDDRLRQPSGDRLIQPSGDRLIQPSGDRLIQPSGDRLIQPSGDRLIQPSGDRLIQPSGDRLRHLSNDRLRQASGDRSRQASGNRSRQTSGDRSRQPSGNSIFSEFSNLTAISPNLFLDKDKNVFFLQTIDAMTGSLDDLQSPDFSMFSSSPINIMNTNMSEISLPGGRMEFDSNISSSFNHLDVDRIELLKDQNTSDSLAGVNQLTPVVQMSTSEPSGQKAARNPVLNSILSRPPNYQL